MNIDNTLAVGMKAIPEIRARNIVLRFPNGAENKP